ncbi:MAG: hypothetical protein ACE5G8_11385 [Anaerolineae bacterium]
MPVVSARTLNILAAGVWFVGGIVLVLKGSSLAGEAGALRPGLLWPWLAVLTGLAAGGLKARYLFSRSCRKNLRRIATLKSPKVWQFFRPKFLFFLTLMILAGSTLSRMAHGSYPFLCAVAALDISIGVALLSSGAVFFQERAFAGQAVIPTAGR